MNEPTPIAPEKRACKKIVVFQHEDTLTFSMSRILEEAGYRFPASLDNLSRIHSELVMPKEFDVIVADLRLLYTSGLTTLKVLHSKYRKVPIIVRHKAHDIQTIGEAYRLGARGYLVSAETSPEDLVEAVDLVANGHIYIPAKYAQGVTAYLLDYREDPNILRRILTDTEYRIVAYLYQGWSVPAIAERLDTTKESVRTMISTAKRKMEMTDTRVWQLFLNAEFPECVRDLEKVQW